MEELRSLGLKIYLFGIRPDISKELTAKDIALVRDTIYIYPLDLFGIIFANAWFICNRPRYYVTTLSAAVFNEEADVIQHLKLIYHFFISPCLALHMKKNNVEHIHAHFTNVASTIAMYSAGLLGISYSITMHSGGTKGLRSVIGLKHKILGAKFLCAVCEFTRNYYEKIFHCGNKTFLIHCGINPDDYREAFERKAALKNHITGLISIGRVEEKKGFIFLVEACRHLSAEGMEFIATVIGDGELLEDLRLKTEEYGMGNRIIFKGSSSQEAVRDALGASDICIVPSVTAGTGETEGIPVVIMEAMASGVPVIATRHAGIPEIVIDKQTGMLVPERDGRSIAAAVRLLMADESMRKSCIANGWNMVTEEFNLKKTARLKKAMFEENI